MRLFLRCQVRLLPRHMSEQRHALTGSPSETPALPLTLGQPGRLGIEPEGNLPCECGAYSYDPVGPLLDGLGHFIAPRAIRASHLPAP